VEDFCDYYWLKADLLDFCRQQGIPTGGAKKDLTERIAHFLRTGEIPTARSAKRSAATMPATFSRQTVIGANWHCSQELRAFFEQEIGSRFHFNKVMRDFIKNETGQTLQAAIEAWEEAERHPPPPTDIEPQFEYMRHIREYFNTHPDGNREEALKTWHEKKAQRKSAAS